MGAGPAPNVALRRHVEALEKPRRTLHGGAGARQAAALCAIHDAPSWSRVERIIARVEWAAGIDTRFIVTNLEVGRAKHSMSGSTARAVRREPHQSVENHLAADRTPATRPRHQFRLFLHAVLLAPLVDAPAMPRLGLARHAVRHLRLRLSNRRPRRRLKNRSKPAVEPPDSVRHPTPTHHPPPTTR